MHTRLAVTVFGFVSASGAVVDLVVVIVVVCCVVRLVFARFAGAGYTSVEEHYVPLCHGWRNPAMASESCVCAQFTHEKAATPTWVKVELYNVTCSAGGRWHCAHYSRLKFLVFLLNEVETVGAIDRKCKMTTMASPESNE